MELCGGRFGRFLFSLLSGEMVLTLHVRHGQRAALGARSEPRDRGFTASALAAGAESEGKTHLEMENLNSDFSKRQSS